MRTEYFLILGQFIFHHFLICDFITKFWLAQCNNEEFLSNIEDN